MVKDTVHNKQTTTKLVKYLDNKKIRAFVFGIVFIVFLICIFAAYCNFNYTCKCKCTLL